jgi:hypothetical protein
MPGRVHTAAALTALVLCSSSACEGVKRPIDSAVRLRLGQIYDPSEWLQRVPRDLAITLYGRAKLRGFLDELELPRDVHHRLVDRLDRDDFVDELVPFLLFVREMYQAPEGKSAETFEEHLRARFSPGDGVPGIEHGLFAWQAAEDAAAGVLERTVFGLAGDHGLAPVFHLLNPEIEIFEALRDEGVDFRVEKISSDEGEGPKLNNPFDPPTMKGIDVVVASTAGGNYMLDLFVDQGAGFVRQPLANELRAIRPLAAPDARPVDLLEEIAARLADSLDYLVVRDAPCTLQGGTVLLIGRRDGRRGSGLTLCHYVVDIGPQSDGPTACLIRDDFAEKFGESFLVPSQNEAELAFGRVFENFLPPLAPD